jgi:hypothetical protein
MGATPGGKRARKQADRFRLSANFLLLDREFLRFANSVEGFMEARPSHSADELRMRFEDFPKQGSA